MKTKIILFFCLNVTHFMDDTRHNYRLLVVGRICHTQVRSTALNKAPDNNFFAFIVSIFFYFYFFVMHSGSMEIKNILEMFKRSVFPLDWSIKIFTVKPCSAFSFC